MQPGANTDDWGKAAKQDGVLGSIPLAATKCVLHCCRGDMLDKAGSPAFGTAMLSQSLWTADWTF